MAGGFFLPDGLFFARIGTHRQHPEPDALPVQQPLAVRDAADALNSMADGVAEVEQLAGTGFPLILLDDPLFKAQRAQQNLIEVGKGVLLLQ